MARILLADDEAALARLIARALALDGHCVTPAGDGAEALEALAREQGSFDLLLTDIRMPMMDGIALALGGGARPSAAPDPADDRLCRSARARTRAATLIHDVLMKPFSQAAMRAAVKERSWRLRTAAAGPGVTAQ